MYMGVILINNPALGLNQSAPHVYGGDPGVNFAGIYGGTCSPCIWG